MLKIIKNFLIELLAFLTIFYLGVMFGALFYKGWEACVNASLTSALAMLAVFILAVFVTVLDKINEETK